MKSSSLQASISSRLQAARQARQAARQAGRRQGRGEGRGARRDAHLHAQKAHHGSMKPMAVRGREGLGPCTHLDLADNGVAEPGLTSSRTP